MVSAKWPRNRRYEDTLNHLFEKLQKSGATVYFTSTNKGVRKRLINSNLNTKQVVFPDSNDSNVAHRISLPAQPTLRREIFLHC